MSDTPKKKRTRLWVQGDAEFKKQWNDWAKNQGVIAEDFLRKLVEKAMQHGKISFDVECGYKNSQSDNPKP